MTKLIQDIVNDTLESKKERSELNTLFTLDEYSNNIVVEGLWSKVKDSLKLGIVKFKKKLTKATTKKELDEVLEKYASYIEKSFKTLNKTVADKKWLEDQLDSEEITLSFKGCNSLEDVNALFKQLEDFYFETVKIENEANKELTAHHKAYVESTDKDLEALTKAVKATLDNARKDSLSAMPSFCTFDKGLHITLDNKKDETFTVDVDVAASTLEKAISSNMFKVNGVLGVWEDMITYEIGDEDEDLKAFDLIDGHRLMWVNDLMVKSEWIEGEYADLIIRYVQSVLKALPEDN